MNCPQCSQPIEQDFGVITCQNCGAVLMVDIEGNVQVSDPSNLEPTENQAPLVTSQQSETIEDFQDVIEFANTETANGPLTYTLVIQGIDNAELKEKVKEALQDQKLKLNVEELLNSIVNGRLELKNLNPTKTSLVIQRLDEEKLQLQWSQHVY